MTETLTEEKLIALAEAVGDHKNVFKFGLKLGFKKSEVSTYISTNRRNDSSEGTTSMLFDWKRKTRSANQIPDIIKALEDAGFAELVDDFFPSGEDVSQETATTSRASTSTGAADMSALPHTISEGELLMLSTEIGPSYYKKVGVNLNISIVTLDNIKEHTRDNCEALMTAFTRWRDKQLPDTNIRAHLAEALQKSGLVLLSQKLITGNLLTESTGAPVTIPVSETKPLSPDLIEKCKDELQFKYRTDFCMIRADPLDPDSVVPFQDMYTNLFLEKEKRKERSQLEYKDLFNLRINGVFPKRIMIQGEAGAGKTTFLAKIAWDWINDSPDLSKFVWVLIIPLREAKRCTIGQIVKSYLSKDNPATACQITEYIRSNPEKVFIACDGLDEFSGKVVQHTETKQGSEGAQSEFKVGSETSPASISMHTRTNTELNVRSVERGDITVEDILRSDELRTCPVMVTSRPWKANEIRGSSSLRNRYTFIHVEGFSRENAKVYIRNYFKDTEATADEFIQLFESNDIISENMAPYPIYISILCHMWRELDDNKKEKLKAFQRYSEIFCEVFEFLKVRYVQKEIPDLTSRLFNTFRSEIEKLLKPISKVAFTGLQSNNLIFNKEDLEQYSDSLKTACKVGLLSQENKLSSIHDKSSPFLQSTIFFPHKLFQEYMAAVYLVSLYDSDRIEFNRLIEEVVIPRKEEFRYLLYFTVSQDKTIAKYTTKCLLQQYAQSKGDDARKMNFLVDVTFERQDEDTNAMLQNSVSSLSIDVRDTHTLAGYAFTRIYSKAIKMYIGRYLTSYGPGISNEVALMICSAPSLWDVRLTGSFHPTFYETLAREGRKATVHTLQIENNKPLSSASSHHLVGALCSLPNLTNLTLSRVCDKEEFCSHLNEKASTLKVHTLKIWNNKPLSSASSHHLVEALCSLPNLTNLMLIGVCDQEEFCSRLNEKASTLKVHTLQILIDKPLSSASSHHLVEALCSLPNLTNLILIGVCEEEEFCSHLNEKASTLKVRTLEILIDKSLSSASSHHLVEALCSLPNLTNLILRGVCDEEFCSHLNEKASTLKGSFPQISKGNFMFNEEPQKDLQSFLQTLSYFM
ncbi:NACHT, LRR and PYD domains-containing protein 12-like isoform X2 [Lytechinus pictus]|uniref:NACHT, LRR and PYD domains-containing protein 12-like isoform X2 n=1 Tax=Lytechinus pictus TaxID=7653 RepID=UPI0030B9E812